MSLPAFRSAPNGQPRLDGELTRLNCDGQFKPFIYLNGGGAGPAYLLEVSPACGSRLRPAASWPDLIRPSIMLRKSPAGERWTPGSSPGVTIDGATAATPLPKSPKRKAPPCGGTFLLSLMQAPN